MTAKTPNQALGASPGAPSLDDLRQDAEAFGFDFLEQIDAEMLDHELVMRFPFDFLKKHVVLPLRRADGSILVAMGSAMNLAAYDSIVQTLAEPCDRAIAPADVIEINLTHCYYHDEGDRTSEMLEEADDDLEAVAGLGDSAQVEDLMDVANRAPIIRLVNSILYQAVQTRASDIHIEPYEHNFKVRFRIDGVLHEQMAMPKQYVAALVSRVKILAGLNIAEKRLPQDGRSRIKIGDTEIDLRVSTIPTSGGERVVLRLLERGGGTFGLNELGFAPNQARAFARLVHRPHGIILMTGPTGSGKTTSLYAALRDINTEDRNILTVEDPIEYQLPGVGQMQVNGKIGLTFAGSLRHILRQDPDVIMIGEIRDFETAEIAIQAALTGHLVLSTLHTNDSASAVTRLVDMGVEPFLVASSVIAIMAQRLIRVICPECRQGSPATADTVAAIGGGLDVGQTVYQGAGCDHCLQTGYLGRTAILELLLVNEEIREMVVQRASAADITRVAREAGMRSLREDGLRKIAEGATTIEEVLRVTQDDEIRYQ